MTVHTHQSEPERHDADGPAAPLHARPHARPWRLDRRTFLTGAAATGLLVACSGSDDADSDPGDDTVGTDGASTSDAATVDPDFDGSSAEIEPGTFTLLKRFPPTVAVTGRVRLPHSLGNGRAELVNDGPLTLGAQVVDIDGNPIGERIDTPRRDVDAALTYYAFTPTIDAPGIYGLVVDGGPPEGSSFQVFEPESVSIPTPGDLLPGFDTPTVGAPAGVDPICTRDPVCPFHSVTLSEALNTGRPVAYLVGTPAFCQTGTCAPALEALVDLESEFADDIVFVHAEVYTDLTATTITPAVEALGLDFEPAIFITDATGTVVDRLDGLWDVTELREALSAVTG